MRLLRESALVLFLCLWIPVEYSYGALAPEDQDGSGDDYEFSASGSGSGDDDFLIMPVVTTQASPNTTKTAWFTNAPVHLPEHPVTQFVSPHTEPKTSGHDTEAPPSSTTQITETQTSPIIIKSLGSEEDQKSETTTVSAVTQPKTTLPPAEKLPVVPTHKEQYTTTAHDEEDTKESFVIEEATSIVEAVSVTTKAPKMETTPALRSTSTASNSADIDASGDSVESTTMQAIEDNLIEIIPKEHIPINRNPNPTMGNGDFGFDNEIQKPGTRSGQPGSESDFALGSASDNDSLLERKEVLAGVIAGGVVGLAFAIMLVTLMVYRMKKKDEGSYSLDEHKHPNGGYQKPQKQEEFLA
ncbi:syndecan-1-like [Silurus meridionalis]|uniref:Syndecan n=1 Tax=Silurus meridionalis TaxID=175797 RepID=A0A8T0BC87_SILME|nr:syndecan-1-like [Silurus meridionalis]KAF7704635.1 hypothetical protein HF521_021707 [Silurus meridionalis]